MDFHGAKGAVLIGGSLVAILRDHRPGLPHPGLWDLPGGGREGAEAPRATMTRETREELGLDLAAAEWLWERAFPAMADPSRTSWFLVLRLPEAARGIALGAEGQGWALMPPARFLALPDAVPALQHRLRVWMAGLGEDGALA